MLPFLVTDDCRPIQTVGGAKPRFMFVRDTYMKRQKCTCHVWMLRGYALGLPRTRKNSLS